MRSPHDYPVQDPDVLEVGVLGPYPAPMFGMELLADLFPETIWVLVASDYNEVVAVYDTSVFLALTPKHAWR